MSISAAFFSTSTSAVLLNASGKNGSVTLPYTQSTIGRVMTFKDSVGGITNGVSTITFSTFNDDSFENGSNLLNLPNKFGQISLLAGADKKWYQLGGTIAYQQLVSSLLTSSIQGDGIYLTDIPHPTTLASSIAGLGTANYVSTASLTSTVSSYVMSAGGISRANLTSTVAGLGRSIYVSSTQLFSTVTSLTANVSTMIDSTELSSTIQGLGTATFVSTAGLNTSLVSTVAGLGTAGYISSLGTSYSVSSLTITNNATTGAISTNSASLTGFTTSSIMASNYTLFKPSSSTETRYVFSGTVQGAAGVVGGVSSFYQIQYSDDGSNWYSSLTISTTVGYLDRSQVRYLSTNLFGIVVTPYGAGSGGFYTSADGKNWFKRGDPGYQQYTDVTYNGTYLVTNGYGTLKYSTDLGATYSNPTNGTWSDANQYGRETNFATAYNSTTGMFVAAGAGTNSNPTMLKYTTTPTTWSNVTFTSSISGLTQYCYDIALGGTTNTRWVAVGPFGGFYSDDASNWSPCVGLTTGYVLDYLPATWTVAYSRPLDRWVVGGYQRLHTSADGITYGANLWSNAIGMDILAKAEWLNGKYYATGRLLSGCNISTSVISSDNGSNWAGSAVTGGISAVPTLSYQNYQTASIAYGGLQRQLHYPVNFASDGSKLLLNGVDYMGAYTKDAFLQSTMVGAGFISTSQLTSTVTGISTTLDSYVTPTEMQSTVTGLGTAAYISTFPPNALLSTVSSGDIMNASTLNTSRITGTFATTSTVTSRNLVMFDLEVISSAGVYVATGWQSTRTGLSNLLYSADGSNWSAAASVSTTTAVPNNTNALFVYGVRYASTNLYFATTSEGYGVTSSNGSNWFETKSFATAFGAADGAYNNIFGNGYIVISGRAGTRNGAGTIAYTSNYGQTWTSNSSGGFLSGTFDSVRHQSGIAFNSNINLFVAGGLGNYTSNLNPIQYTTNPATWSNVTFTSTITALNPKTYDVKFRNNLYVAIGDYGTMWSTDGSNFSPGSNISATNSVNFSIDYSPTLNLWVAVGSNYIKTSSDGKSWGATNYDSTHWYNYVEWTKDRFMATAKSSNVSDANASRKDTVRYSTDGTTWLDAFQLDANGFSANVSGVPAVNAVTYGDVFSFPTVATRLTTDGTSLLIDGNNIGRNYAATATVPSTLSGYTFISTTQLTSTVTGLQTYVSSFIDTTELASTVAGVGSAQYISSLGLTTTFTSTVTGLGTSGFVSSTAFVSSINGISTNLTGASGEFISTIVNNYYNTSSFTVASNVNLYGPSYFSYGVYNGSTFVTIDALTSTMDSYFNQPVVYAPQNYSF